MRDHSTRKQWRKKDYKRVTARLDYEVDPDYQKLV